MERMFGKLFSTLAYTISLVKRLATPPTARSRSSTSINTPKSFTTDLIVGRAKPFRSLQWLVEGASIPLCMIILWVTAVWGQPQLLRGSSPKSEMVSTSSKGLFLIQGRAMITSKFSRIKRIGSIVWGLCLGDMSKSSSLHVPLIKIARLLMS